MNSLGNPSFLSVELPESLTTSPSVSTFMPEEDASICPLLGANSPSPPLDFTHPLTPSTGNDINSDARKYLLFPNNEVLLNHPLQQMIKLKQVHPVALALEWEMAQTHTNIYVKMEI